MQVLKHSKWDAVPITLSLAYGAALFAAPVLPVVALGVWWGSNTVSHLFVHSPFFTTRLMNSVFSVYLTLLLGIPQTLWRERHLAHHRGKTYRLRLTEHIVAEFILVVNLWAFLCWLSPQFFLGTYLPGYLTGLGLCYIHGYFEHAWGTTSNYGLLYNLSFLNDGYHVEHHARPAEHWTRLPVHVQTGSRRSRFPSVLRWLETLNLEFLERIVVRSGFLQRFLLRTHERAIRALLQQVGDVRTVIVVGGGMFPRTALILRKLLPDAEITILDASAAHLKTADPFFSDRADIRTRFVHETFVAGTSLRADLAVIPLAFVGDRKLVYEHPPARLTLIHDWLWISHRESVTVSWALLKRLNLVRQ